MQDRLARAALTATALVSAAGILLIALAVTVEGWPALPHLFGAVWSPEEGRFGVLPLLAGSVLVTLGSLAGAVPLGIGMGLFLSEVAPPQVADLVRPLLRGMAAVPSVVFGFLGLTLVVPWIRAWFGGPGLSLLAGCIVLAVMVLPTMASVAEDAFRAVDPSLREGAYALGASPGQVAWRLLLPAARGGLAAAVVLALGRALGETMAVLMVTGNAAALPRSPLDPVRTLTGNIALEMAYATGRHRQALFASGALLLLLNLAVNQLARRAAGRGGGGR
ncbi:MAG: phosphate ABC transporter permease subunit PstC [Symbiobacterium sp.]|uniref:phosphate ABC transporter permease subunit PstC n=1 Tax=Symbiobacterium sp. TaxID=1971213 RepID=UPI003463DDC4